ncbi:hypothetical protein LINGRAHAP2_LOCUS13923 [Linum grandiflorum]
MAKYAVTENNNEHPELDQLRFVSLDKGYYEAGTISTTYKFYLTTASNHQGKAKYVAYLYEFAGHGGNLKLISFDHV